MLCTWKIAFSLLKSLPCMQSLFEYVLAVVFYCEVALGND
jgi:hypothetical protein